MTIIDLEFIFHLHVKIFKHTRTENDIIHSSLPVTLLHILPMKLYLAFVCLVVHLVREFRNSLTSPFPSNSPKKGEVIPTD